MAVSSEKFEKKGFFYFVQRKDLFAIKPLFPNKISADSAVCK